MNKKVEARIRENIKQWLENIVIGLNLCPFARQPWVRGQVSIEILSERGFDAVVEECLRQLHTLDRMAANELDSMLLVLPYGFELFDDFLDLLDVLDALIDLKDWRGRYQLASFHPKYQFEGTHIEDRQNYTNRSPHPIVHVLREDSVSAARSRHPNTESIPDDNIQLLEGMSEDEFARLFMKS